MINIFKKRNNIGLKADIHSHLLPDLDDGVEDMEESLAVIKEMEDIGYQKIITTPHLSAEYYPNTPDGIKQQLAKLQAFLRNNDVNIQVDAAAEYLLDEHFQSRLESGEELLTFGKNFILVETSFMNEPMYLKDVIFKLNAKGIRPILAHPERYVYFQQNLSKVKDLSDMSLYYQVNIGSLIGYYGKAAQKLGEWLVDHKMIRFLGTDCHGLGQIQELKSVMSNKYFKKALKLDLLNNTL